MFNSGTTDWVYGLLGHDPVVTQATRNLLDTLSEARGGR